MITLRCHLLWAFSFNHSVSNCNETKVEDITAVWMERAVNTDDVYALRNFLPSCLVVWRNVLGFVVAFVCEFQSWYKNWITVELDLLYLRVSAWTQVKSFLNWVVAFSCFEHWRRHTIWKLYLHATKEATVPNQVQFLDLEYLFFSWLFIMLLL